LREITTASKNNAPIVAERHAYDAFSSLEFIIYTDLHPAIVLEQGHCAAQFGTILATTGIFVVNGYVIDSYDHGKEIGLWEQT